MREWNSGRSSAQVARAADRLKLRQLRLLVSLGEQGTLGRAAAAVNVTQPTATKMLAECEAALGLPLYERSPRGLQSTPAGREVLTFARRVMSEFVRTSAALDALRRGGAGVLTVGAILGATPDVIARAVIDMKQRHPELTIRLRGESSDQVLGMLEDRVVDVAVGRFSDSTQHNRFHYEPLGDEALCIVARAGHPLARERHLDLRALQDQRWVMQFVEAPARQILEDEFGKAGAPTPADIIETHSIFTIIQLLERSDAVAMLSEPLVRDHLAANLLCRLPVTIGARLSDFGLLTRRNEVLTGTSAAFAERLRALSRPELSR